MLLLDKIDLFSVNTEKRRMRIEEIFDERINDIKEAEKTFDTATIETMRAHKVQFTSIRNGIQNAIDNNNIVDINTKLFELASFMSVDLGYNSQEEFVDKFDDMEIAL